MNPHAPTFTAIKSYNSLELSFNTPHLISALNPCYCMAQDDVGEAPRLQKATLAAGLSRLQLADLNDKKLAAAVSERDRTILALTETSKVRI